METASSSTKRGIYKLSLFLFLEHLSPEVILLGSNPNTVFLTSIWPGMHTFKWGPDPEVLVISRPLMNGGILQRKKEIAAEEEHNFVLSSFQSILQMPKHIFFCLHFDLHYLFIILQRVFAWSSKRIGHKLFGPKLCLPEIFRLSMCSLAGEYWKSSSF